MGITRRQLLVGAAALGAAKLMPSVGFGEEGLDPEKHVFVVGDLHLTKYGKYAYAKTEIAISNLKGLSGGKKGFHLIFNGDMLQFPNLAETCKDGAKQWEEFARLYLSLRGLGFIPHLNFGNHDGSEHFAWEVLKGTVAPEYIGNSSFVLGGTKFILLSGIHPEKLDSGFLDSELEPWKGRRAVVATHFPPDKLTWIRDKFGKEPGYSLWAKEEILESIVRARADVLCSHSHSSFAGTYSSCGLKEQIRVVGTPSVDYTLPYLRTDFRPPEVAGITVLDVRDFLKAKYFDGKKAFRPPHLRVESRKGRFEPRPLRVGL